MQQLKSLLKELIGLIWDRFVEIYSVVLNSSFNFLFLYFGWNYGVIKFINVNRIEPLDALILLFCFQFLGISCLRRVNKEFVPYPIGVDKGILLTEIAKNYRLELEAEEDRKNGIVPKQ